MDEKGQVLVEFVFCIIIFALFIFGLIGVTTWGAASYFAQEAAHEAARKYAVTYDKSKAEKMGLDVLNKWAYIFIDTSSSSVDVATRDKGGIYRCSEAKGIKKLFVLPCLK